MVFAGVFAFALCFAAYTRHAWEDYYITYRVSKNLATGHGLVYTVGERVHAFTSPLNVLLPAALSVMTGNTSDEIVLWLFRVLCCSLLGAAAVLLLDVARKNSLTLGAAGFLVAMFGLDAKIVDFSINGQEIAFMMFFLALALNALSAPSRWTGVKLGLAWAGLMWTRPDGFIYFGAVALGFLLFDAGRSIGESRLGLLKVFLCAGAITTVLISAVGAMGLALLRLPDPAHPHGKRLRSSIPSFRPARFIQAGVRALEPPRLSFPYAAWAGLLPTKRLCPYTRFSEVGPTRLSSGASGSPVCVPCIGVLPFGRPQGRAVSFAFMLSLLYLTDAPDFPRPWYLPNAAILGIFVLTHVVQQGFDFAQALKDKWAPFSRPLTNLGAGGGSRDLIHNLAGNRRLRLPIAGPAAGNRGRESQANRPLAAPTRRLNARTRFSWSRWDISGSSRN